ncbi:hypothetical protein D9M71_847540 [compost metagenome]
MGRQARRVIVDDHRERARSYKVFVSGGWPIQVVHCSKDPAISVQTQVMEREGGSDGSAVLYRTGSR